MDSRIDQGVVMNQGKLLSLEEMAAELGKCSKTFAKYVRKYRIPHLKLGRTMLFDQVEVIAFLKARVAIGSNTPETVPSSPKRVTSRKRSTSEFAGTLTSA